MRAFEVVTNTYTVNSAGDEPNAGSPATSCDTDADPAVQGTCTLRAAIQAANADVDTTDRIVVPAGTIALTGGQINISSDLVINGAGAASTIVDANDTGRIFDLDASANDATAEITGLTLTDGSATSSSGGAVYVGDTSALTLADVTLSENTASDGGAVYVEGDASLWLDRVTATKNVATDDGGALYIAGAAFVADSTIGGASAADGNGSTDDGGGLYNDGTLTVVDTAIRNNQITGSGQGGGLHNTANASVTRGSVSENRIVSMGSAYGGGVSNDEVMLLTGTTISGNTARGTYIEGVGVYNDNVMTLSDVTVAENVGTMTQAGGDVYGAGVSNEYTLSMQGGALRNNRGQGVGTQSYTDGVTTNSSTTFESEAADFTPSDTGKTITGAGIPSGTTITWFDENTVTLSQAATASGNPVAFAIVDRIDAYGYGGGLYNNYTANLNGVTIEGNSLDGMDKTGGTYVEGAGVANEDSMTLANSVVRNNTGRADDVYGVIYSDSDMTLQDVTITGSVADAGSYVEGAAIDNEDYMKIVDVTVDDTVATASSPNSDIYGGAVYHYDSEPEAWDGLRISDTTATAVDYIAGGALATEQEILLSDSSITNTRSTTTGADSSIEGGAWYFYYGGVATNVQVLGTSTTAQGLGSDVYGAAIYQDDDAVYRTVTIDSTVVTAGDEIEGGGLWTDYPITMEDSSITRTTASTRDAGSTIEGGGLYLNDEPSSMVNVTIAENTATAGGEGSEAEGGGIYADDDLRLTHVTVTANSANGLTAVADDPATAGDETAAADDADAGGGIYVTDDVTLRSSIVANNSPSDANCSTGGGGSPELFHSAGYNLESGDTCSFDTVGDLVNTDPKLASVQNNGGSTFTTALLPGSPAIDAASNNGCPPKDQRGQARPIGTSCDIGAFEFVPAPASTAPPATTAPAAEGGTAGAAGPKATASSGYRMVAADGGIFTFGDRVFHGSTGDLRLNKPIVGGATNQSTFDGYWIVASDGGVFTFNAPFYGSLGDQVLSAPATEIEPTPTGLGYWIVLADGRVFTFGDANYFGDMGGKALNKPIIGMSVTPSGKGYWLVGEDGGIFNFGDAGFFGSTGSMKLNAPIIDLAPAVDNNGYYLLAKDGGVFTFGSADFKGSTGSLVLNAPVVAMLVDPTGAGYWLAATDGGIFTFGSVPFHGSMGGTKLNSPVLDLIN